ncbi:DUF4123 domain-containing protein [Providencia stuartii]|uniref:DUF4123 domain-containing protein n=1 Tax=Providencia stuartii TaxID=588 RepID=UPI00214DA3DA
MIPKGHLYDLFTLEQIHTTASDKLYLLVNGLQYEKMTGKIIEYKKNISMPLFLQYPNSKYASAGPWLIEARYIDNQHLQEIRDIEPSAPMLSWIVSQEKIDRLTLLLANHLYVSLPNNESALFRFYDPRVLNKLDDFLSEQQKSTLTIGIQKWFYVFDNQMKWFKWI